VRENGTAKGGKSKSTGGDRVGTKAIEGGGRIGVLVGGSGVTEDVYTPDEIVMAAERLKSEDVLENIEEVWLFVERRKERKDRRGDTRVAITIDVEIVIGQDRARDLRGGGGRGGVDGGESFGLEREDVCEKLEGLSGGGGRWTVSGWSGRVKVEVVRSLVRGSGYLVEL
jgi:hypothetical protein